MVIDMSSDLSRARIMPTRSATSLRTSGSPPVTLMELTPDWTKMRVSLVIAVGVSNYRNGDLKLDYVAGDARALGWMPSHRYSHAAAKA